MLVSEKNKFVHEILKNKTRSRWQLWSLRSEFPHWSQHPTKFRGHNFCESGDFINLFTWPLWVHVTSHEVMWQPLIASHHIVYFDGHSTTANRDITYLICHVTSGGHVFTGLCNFIYRVHWSRACGDVTNLICHVTSQCHVLKDYVAIWAGAILGSHYPAKFGGSRHWTSEDKMFLGGHVIL